MNYYEILEISENASEEVIRSAYKSLAKKYTPISQKQIRTPKNAWQRSMPLMMSCLIRFPGGHTICACAPKRRRMRSRQAVRTHRPAPEAGGRPTRSGRRRAEKERLRVLPFRSHRDRSDRPFDPRLPRRQRYERAGS